MRLKNKKINTTNTLKYKKHSFRDILCLEHVYVGKEQLALRSTS